MSVLLDMIDQITEKEMFTENGPTGLIRIEDAIEILVTLEEKLTNENK